MDLLAKQSLVGAICFLPFSHSLAYLFMTLTLVSWLAAGGYQQRLEVFTSHPITWSVLFILTLLYVGTTYSSGETEDIWLHISKYTKLAYLLLAITLLQEDQWRQRAYNAFGLAMGITLLISMLSLFVEIPFMKGDSGSMEGNHYVFKDHIIQNLMMSFFVLLMLTRAQESTSPAQRLLYWAIAACASINIIGFVFGRTGYIALGAALIIFFYLYSAPRWRWLSLIGLLAACAVLLPLSDAFRARTALITEEIRNHQPNKMTSVGARIEMTRVSMDLVRERPLTGWGTGAYPKHFCERVSNDSVCATGIPSPQSIFIFWGSMGTAGHSSVSGVPSICHLSLPPFQPTG